MLSHWVLNHLKCKSQKTESKLFHIYEKVADILINDYAICFSYYSGCEILPMKVHRLAYNQQHQSKVSVSTAIFCFPASFSRLREFVHMTKHRGQSKRITCYEKLALSYLYTLHYFYRCSLWKKQKDIYKELFQSDLLQKSVIPIEISRACENFQVILYEIKNTG